MSSSPMRFVVTELYGPDRSAKFTPWHAPGALNDAGQIVGYRAPRAAVWERGRDRFLQWVRKPVRIGDRGEPAPRSVGGKAEKAVAMTPEVRAALEHNGIW